MLKLFRYLKPYRWAVAAVMALVLLQSLSELYLPTLMADIVNDGVVKGDTPYIWKIGGFMLAVTAVGTLVSIAASYLSARIAAGFGKDVRSKTFRKVESFSLLEFDKIGTASLITRTTNDITQVQSVLIMMMRMMVMAPMMCIGGLIMAISKDAQLSLVFVGALPVLALTIYLIASKGIPYFKVMQKKIDKLNLVLREGLTGIRVIRSFNRLEHESKRFDEANGDLTQTAIKVNQIMAFMMPMMMLILNFSSLAIIWFGGLRVSGGHMQVGDLMAFLQYAMQIMFSLLMVSMMFVMVPRASASAVRINEVLELQASGTEQGAEPSAGERQSAVSKRGEVEFDRVSFRYPGAENPAISGISFRSSPGEVTAIIGGTGSGKSTLISMIPRFYDAEEGAVRIDGVDVRERSVEELRAMVGLVPQKAQLFTGTVSENIRYGKNEASDEEVRHAASIAQASDFIEKLPEGYSSPVAQGGTNLSGGQKQRLSIARALVRRPSIYVFDDSFSALDFKTDAKLRAALRSETTDATVIIVAQRVSTVMDADQIVVLDDGRIAGIGNHQELMATCEVYREIVSSQLSEEEIA
ncbi:multidrug ABC transporter ATP-binding protein [Cohnella sp. CIP 111063]|uniref:ABC transporter ATP-binding protein n=1 Tax=unclassified Cohnella TaxID=2636738 RepID=UPI000B8C38B4|nr:MULTISPECIES: ABC transporter ATP-binding protein [unclassified Cohnella]OXS53094.1 multidrug ABC transporter ATP-binding protein [Cohnella sp. CIP 111063]PRX60605.1 ATP-binding cassette subfamily B protein [Cohnella sp. SGD-V74]